jgi:rhodanese-related sulfurtransferase
MKKFAIYCLSLFVIISSASIVQGFTPMTSWQSYAEMIANSSAYILDVRTAEEWEWVGHPGKNKSGYGEELVERVLNISYNIYKAGTWIVNPSFITDVEEAFPDKSVTLILMCRSGQRSKLAAAALETAGYTDVVDMSDGFEGATDGYGYRTVSGWKLNGLPYGFGRSGSYSD